MKTEAVGKGVFSRLSSYLIGSFQQSIGFVTANIFMRFTSQLNQLGGAAMDAVSNFESLRLTLETVVARDMVRSSGGALKMADALSQSTEKTKELMQWLQELAIRSPYATEQVTESFLYFARYGMPVEKAKELADALLQVAAGSGLTQENLNSAAYALAQLSGSDKILMQDLRQLLNAGIDVRSILDELGVSFSNLNEDTRELGITTQDFIKKFIQISKRDFAGSVGRMAKSWAGMKGALQDIKDVGLRALFQGVFDVLQPLVQKFTDWMLGPGLDKLQQMGKTLGEIAMKVVNLGEAIAEAGVFSIEAREALSWISPELVTIYDKVAPILEKIVTKVSEVFGKVKNVFATAFEKGIFSEEFENALGEISPELEKFYTETLEPWLQDVLKLFGKIKNAFVAAFTEGISSEEFESSLGEISPQLEEFYTGTIEPWVNKVVEKLGEIKDKFVEYKDVLLGAGKTALIIVGSFLALSGIASIIASVVASLSSLNLVLGLIAIGIGLFSLAWETNWAGMRDTLTQIWQESILPTFEAIKLKFSEIVGETQTSKESFIDWASIWDFITGLFRVGFQVLRREIGMFFALLRGDFDAFKMHLKEFSITILEYVNHFIEAFGGKPIENVRAAVEAIDVNLWLMVEVIKLRWQDAVRYTEEQINQFVQGIVNGFTTAKNKVSEKVQEIVNAIKSKFNIGNFVSIGKDIVDGIVRGVLDSAYKIALAFNGAIIPVIQTIKDILGIHSPSAVFREIGAQMALGLQQGFYQQLRGLQVDTGNFQQVVPSTSAPINVVINVDAQVSSDIDIQNLARRLAEEIGKQTRFARGYSV
jgi:tape measure domain-containing protein